MIEIELVAAFDIDPRRAVEIAELVERNGGNALMALSSHRDRTVNLGSVIGTLSSLLKKGELVTLLIDSDADPDFISALCCLLGRVVSNAAAHETE